MFRLLFRFLLWTFAFYFVYRFIQGILKALIGETKKPPQSFPPQQPQAPEQPKYNDVKDANFKDLPKDPSAN